MNLNDGSFKNFKLEKKNIKAGNLFIISAPSGAGKTTLVKAVLDRFPNMVYSVSYTTRSPRNGEKNGIDYHFIKEEEFEKKIKENLWAEWAKVHDNYYGTSAEFLDKCMLQGNNVLLDIDVHGMIQLLKRYPESITVFVAPPSIEILKKRLEKRGTDSKKSIKKRLFNAEKEMAQKHLYKYVIVNDLLSLAIENLLDIIQKHY